MKNFLIFIAFISFASCKTETKKPETIEKEAATSLMAGSDTLIYPEEEYFKSIRQVTFGGDNAEAYWSFDDKKLIFQSNNPNWGLECDQMFLMNASDNFKNAMPPMVSTGMGRTTCAYFLPDNKHFVYGSTHLAANECPEVPLRKTEIMYGLYMIRSIFLLPILKGILLRN